MGQLVSRQGHALLGPRAVLGRSRRKMARLSLARPRHIVARFGAKNLGRADPELVIISVG